MNRVSLLNHRYIYIDDITSGVQAPRVILETNEAYSKIHRSPCYSESALCIST
jgi:hypothetical protein